MSVRSIEGQHICGVEDSHHWDGGQDSVTVVQPEGRRWRVSLLSEREMRGS